MMFERLKISLFGLLDQRGIAKNISKISSFVWYHNVYECECALNASSIEQSWRILYIYLHTFTRRNAYIVYNIF